MNKHEQIISNIANDLDGASIEPVSIEHTCHGAIFCGVPRDVARAECFMCEEEEADAAAAADIERRQKLEQVEHVMQISGLSSYAAELIVELPTDGWQQSFVDASKPRVEQWSAARFETPTRVVAWLDADDNVQMGVARGRYAFDDTIDASPFPGAWVRVHISKIVNVQHPEAF